MIIFNDVIIDNENVCSVYSNRIQWMWWEEGQSQTKYSHIISFVHKEKIFMTFRDSYITEILFLIKLEAILKL